MLPKDLSCALFHDALSLIFVRVLDMNKNQDLSERDVRCQLLNRLEVLTGRIAHTDNELKHAQEPLLADDSDRATQTQDDEVLRQLEDAASVEISAINAALDRLDNGRYGMCVLCQQPIGTARLAVVPYTLYCMACATASTPKVTDRERQSV